MESTGYSHVIVTEGITTLKSIISTGAEYLLTNTTSTDQGQISSVGDDLTTSSSSSTENPTTTTLGKVIDDVTKAATQVLPKTTSAEPYYEYSSAQFEVLLPCIFGMFVVLALSFIVFYSKHTNQYEVLDKRTSSSEKPSPGNKDDWSTSNGVGELNGAFSF